MLAVYLDVTFESLVTMDLDQEPIPLDSRLHSDSINIIMPCIIEVDVINGCHHLRGGAITLHQRGHVLATAPLSE